MGIKIDRFNELIENNADFIIGKIKTHVPSPTENDYKTGYIVRYFVQKANDMSSYVYEVNELQYTILKQNPFLIVVDLDWKISGNRNEVMEMNRKSILLASKDMKSILLYLPNYLQFYR
jgi:hypothetical protein